MIFSDKDNGRLDTSMANVIVIARGSAGSKDIVDLE